nr:hypothetical protein [Pseudomonas sp. BIGb0427]
MRAHARFQNLLGQIDNEELRWLESLLDQPDTFPRLGSSIVAAHPVLNTTSMDNGVQISTSTTLNDCLVVTLQDGDNPQSLLLYWPGEAGGLLRCANQAELTRCFAINDQSEQSLSLSPVTGDVLAVVLAHHLSQAKTALTTEEAPAAVKEALARRLQVPRHAAREYAFNLIQEQETSATLTGAPRTGWTSCRPAIARCSRPAPSASSRRCTGPRPWSPATCPTANCSAASSSANA